MVKIHTTPCDMVRARIAAAHAAREELARLPIAEHALTREVRPLSECNADPECEWFCAHASDRANAR